MLTTLLLSAACSSNADGTSIAPRDSEISVAIPTVGTTSTSVSPSSVESVATSSAPSVGTSLVVVPDVVKASGRAIFDSLVERLDGARSSSFLAMTKLISECMASKGFDYRAAADPMIGVGFWDRYVWSFPSSEQAKTSGYTQPGYRDPQATPPEEPSRGSPAYVQALDGNVVGEWEVPPGITVPAGFFVGGPILDGCQPTARTSIVGAGDPKAAYLNDNYFVFLQDVRNTAITEATSRPEFLNAEQRWIACMTQAGYEYSGVVEPLNTPWPNPRPGQREVAVAIADADCKISTELVAVGTEVFDTALEKWFESHPGTAEAIVDFAQGVADRSASVLGT